MRAVLMTATGGPDVLELAEVPDPEITAEHDVLVRLRAAGVNPIDTKLRAHGLISGSLPAVLGWDGAGVVEATGGAVTRVRPGDEVYFCDGGFGPVPGTYQELKLVDERYLARKPRGLSFTEAAAAPLVTIAAWEAVRDRARVEPGQHVLVQGGAGGVGHLSVQLARLAGARVATTVRPGPKQDLAQSLGAELCIDYTREDVGQRVRAWAGADGADVVHDTVGGQTFTDCFALVRPYGDLVSNVETGWPTRPSRSCSSSRCGCRSPGCPAPRCSAGPPSASASAASSSRRPPASTRASCGCRWARCSRWRRRPRRTGRWKPGRSSARPCWSWRSARRPAVIARP